MRDLARYWREVRAIQAGLPDFVWLVGETESLVEVGSAVAARLLYAGSHRRAAMEEIRAHAAAELTRCREATRADLRRRGISVVPVAGTAPAIPPGAIR